MGYTIMNKWIKPGLLLYLILVISGSFSISVAETFFHGNSNWDSIRAKGFCPSIGYTVDWIVEETITVTKTRSYSYSPLRSGLFRVFAFIGLFSALIFLSKSIFMSAKKENLPITKNYILLKLRI